MSDGWVEFEFKGFEIAPHVSRRQSVNFNVSGITVRIVIRTFEAQLTEMKSILKFYHDIAATVGTRVSAPFVPGFLSSFKQIARVFSTGSSSIFD